MPRLSRVPSNSVNDRPGRLKLVLRRHRHRIFPAILGGAVIAAGVFGLASLRSTHPGSVFAALRERVALGTASLGLRVSDVLIEGRANTPERLVRAAIRARPGDPMLGFSVASARERVEQLSWVDHATVERRLPGTIMVQLQERRPFAVWQNQGKFVLIDRAGATVTNSDVAAFGELPLVVGLGAPDAAATLIDALAGRPSLSARVVAAVRVGARRWNLVLKSGLTVMLPESHEAAALDRLMAFEKDHQLLDRPLQRVDMRLPDRLVVRPRADVTAAAAPAPKDPHTAPAVPKKPT
ncbi:MAG: cell division protein FtsQ/DivIB [Pseudomonadota bacterium]|nr:cell division protein FtsQ/DivIB [Pseudomonadota bacterium]